MSLLQYILTEGAKSIMVNKIGISEELAEEIQRNHSKKFQFVVASVISNHWNNFQSVVSSVTSNNPDVSVGKQVQDYFSSSQIDFYKEYKNDLKRLEEFTKESNLPKLDFNKIKSFNNIGKVIDLNAYLQKIKDYRDGATPTPQLTNLSIKDALQRSQDWHDQLEASGKTINVKEGQVVIHEFDDGYYWLDLKDNNCEDEADSMGHCGNTSADTLLSLRDPKGEPHVTVAYDYDGTVMQIKGKGNKKPHEKYHPYIVELIINLHTPDPNIYGSPTYNYQFAERGREYTPLEDFHIIDLSNDLLEKIEDKETIAKWFDDHSIINFHGHKEFIMTDVELFVEVSKHLEWSYPSSFLSRDVYYRLDYDEDKKEFYIHTEDYKKLILEYTGQSRHDEIKEALDNNDEKVINYTLKYIFGTDLSEVDEYSDHYKIWLSDEFSMKWILYYESIIDKTPIDELT